MVRRIVEINEELCNGCGACASACHEGAIAMVDGKAKLLRDDYCDGLGDCLPNCPVGAISFIEREAAAYDEAAVKARMEERKKAEHNHSHSHAHGHEGHVCPGGAAKTFHRAEHESSTSVAPQKAESRLAQWPVQIKLVPIHAPYFDGANLLISADCAAYAYASFHEDYMKNHVTLMGCPKLDDVDYSEKLTEILKNNNIKSVKIVRMEVPCCGGIEHAAVTALKNSGKMIPWQVVTLTCDGRVKED